jgi:VanZ family protein
MLFAAMLRKNAPRLIAGLLGGLCFAGGIEFLQVFVESRVSSITDLLLGAVSGAVGGVLVCLSDAIRERTRRAGSSAE